MQIPNFQYQSQYPNIMTNVPQTQTSRPSSEFPGKLRWSPAPELLRGRANIKSKVEQDNTSSCCCCCCCCFSTLQGKSVSCPQGKSSVKNESTSGCAKPWKDNRWYFGCIIEFHWKLDQETMSRSVQHSRLKLNQLVTRPTRQIYEGIFSYPSSCRLDPPW